MKLKKEEIKTFINQFIKFGIIGAVNTVISYAITNGGYYLLHLHEQIANIIAFTITVFISFMLNSKFVFKKDEGENRNVWWTLCKTFISYAGTGLILSNILLVFFIEKIGISKYIAPIFGLIITIPINFLVNKFWSFKTKKTEIENEEN